MTTLNRYLKNMKPRYGFDPRLFKMLQKKCESMKPEEKRGVLVLHEMKLSKAVTFDTSDLTIVGITNLGMYTPDNQKKERGDHALVFLFQPFRGQWIQNVAAFLSKGCANSDVLCHLIIEAIVLLENHGLFIDVVTSDGAVWNRKMWKLFGLAGAEASCDHPCALKGDEIQNEEARQLWFCSDFSHLIKNLRSFIMSKEETWVRVIKGISPLTGNYRHGLMS